MKQHFRHFQPSVLAMTLKELTRKNLPGRLLSTKQTVFALWDEFVHNNGFNNARANISHLLTHSHICLHVCSHHSLTLLTLLYLTSRLVCLLACGKVATYEQALLLRYKQIHHIKHCLLMKSGDLSGIDC